MISGVLSSGNANSFLRCVSPNRTNEKSRNVLCDTFSMPCYNISPTFFQQEQVTVTRTALRGAGDAPLIKFRISNVNFRSIEKHNPQKEKRDSRELDGTIGTGRSSQELQHRGSVLDANCSKKLESARSDEKQEKERATRDIWMVPAGKTSRSLVH